MKTLNIIYRNGVRERLIVREIPSMWFYRRGLTFCHQITTREGSFFFQCDSDAEQRSDAEIKGKIKDMDLSELINSMTIHGLRHAKKLVDTKSREECEQILFDAVKHGRFNDI